MKKEIYKHSDGLWYFDLNWEEKDKDEFGTLIKRCGFHSCGYKKASEAREQMRLTAKEFKDFGG